VLLTSSEESFPSPLLEYLRSLKTTSDLRRVHRRHDDLRRRRHVVHHVRRRRRRRHDIHRRRLHAELEDVLQILSLHDLDSQFH